MVALVALAAALAGCSMSGSGSPAAGATAGAATDTTGARGAAPPAGAGPHAAAATSGSAAGGASAGSGSAVAANAAVDRTHEVPTPAPPEHVAGGWRSPAEAVDVFATRYINWNAQDVSAQLRALASVSVGQARSAMTQAASGTASDYELKQGGVANAGEVESIAPVAGADHEYAVVTRERTTASNTDAYQGLAPEWHLALATVTRTRGGLWVLSEWQPES
jgi:hypothetical protein